jgi:hypothetical protein
MMDQLNYEFTQLTHEARYNLALQQSEPNVLENDNPTLRERALIYLSDKLLNLGQWIRPADFAVHIHGNASHESALEISAKGC